VRDTLAVRGGVLSINPQTNGPLQVRGNLEIVSGTGRVVARVTGAKLCRRRGSANKPFCDGTHTKIGFRSSCRPIGDNKGGTPWWNPPKTSAVYGRADVNND
jgi:CDGSH-type Zn-finger protein